MNVIDRFAARHPLLFALLATMAWMLVVGVGAFVASRLLDTPIGSALAQSLGMLAGTALLLIVMARWGWLRAAGIIGLGSWQLWLVTAGVILYVHGHRQPGLFRPAGPVDLGWHLRPVDCAGAGLHLDRRGVAGGQRPPAPRSA